MLTELQKAPFPWFGGKRQAAPAVWQALGDVHHYVEPFMGSLAVLLERPHEPNRTYYSETVNDLDGLLVNAWRSMQLSPDATAEAASNPVAEADLHARHWATVKWKNEQPLESLMGDPTFHNPVIAGWWIWGQCCWIGSGWASGKGPWHSVDGLFQRKEKAARGSGINRKLPHLGDDGKGVNRPQARELGIGRQLPHLGNDGKGVNHAGARELGLESESEFHPVNMPEIRRWFGYLSARLRHVRILNGDWSRAVTGGASKTISVRMGKGICGVFLDPPYGDVRSDGLYSEDSLTVAAEVQRWCAENGSDPKYRIVLAGYDVEHEILEREHGWRAVEWYKAGFLKGGMGNTSKSKKAGEKNQQKRERLWLSPHCLGAELPTQTTIAAE
jgi:hypothetical protein